MKKRLCIAGTLVALSLTPAFAQPSPPAYQPAPVRPPLAPRPRDPSKPESPNLTHFDLNFPGGTPQEMVKAIEQATGKPLNAIIPTEDSDIILPPLKMREVTVPQLFTALGEASRQAVPFNANFAYMPPQFSNYGFNTADTPITDVSVWYFHADKLRAAPSVPEKTCRFYSLEPALSHGFSVDDIITAIQTGWKMLGDTSPPEISFHKETKLLIAVGEPNKLKIIDDVLQTLERSSYKRAMQIDSTTGLPKPETKPGVNNRKK